jgi:MarR family transcriptional regulator, transcriptional regulator for hemolysin
MDSAEVPDSVRLVRRIFQLNRVLRQRLDAPLEAATGLSFGELLVLRAAALGFDRPRAIVRRVSLPPPSVSRALSLLERRGLLTRSENARDRREVLIIVTEAAHRVLQTAEAVTADQFQRLFPHFRPEQIRSVLAGLDEVWFATGVQDGYDDDRPMPVAAGE